MSRLLHEKCDLPCPKCNTESLFRETPYLWYPTENEPEPHYRWAALIKCETCGGTWLDGKHDFYPARKMDTPPK